MKPIFFPSPAAFRAWLERRHGRARELFVGFHKRHTGKPSLTWPESVDVALCFGWIDGIRRSLDADRYTIRFTPRRSGSTWSAVNLRRMQALLCRGLVHPAGRAAYEARDPRRSESYSYEQRPQKLDIASMRRLRAEPAAWAYFRAQPPWYQRTASYWVMSAKREETRARRLATLIEHSARGRPIPPLARKPKTD